MKTLRKFWSNERGNFAMLAGIVSVPLLGGIALGVDYSEMTRQRHVAQAAVDASGIATAKRIIAGADDAAVKAYAMDFFKANLGKLDATGATLDVTMPDNSGGAGTLKLTARLSYKPYLMRSFAAMIGKTSAASYPFSASTEVRLKNTLEVALVLDNSGSMDLAGKNSSKKRIELLKTAAKELVDTMGAQAKMMTQISNPVRFALVPFAASVNVGSANKSAAWMDTSGLSPVHNDPNFIDWTSMQRETGDANWRVELLAGVWYGRGANWASVGTGYKDKPLTRFTLFDNIQRVVGRSNNADVTGPATAWSGCVETRPYPLNINDTAPSAGNPASLFVPMFAPDEFDPITYNKRTYPAVNNWWDDGTNKNDSDPNNYVEYQRRQRSVAKFLTPAPLGKAFMGDDTGPNYSCSTKPITALKDVSVKAGADSIKAAIDAMQPDGATNVPEGLAWGWRMLSSTPPFTEGRPETEKGNDKVVIVLTDGANTYYTPGSFGIFDAARNMSSYSSFGYTGIGYNAGDTRLFRDPATTYSKTDYSNPNYTKAMNAQFTSLCKDPAFIKATTDSSGKVTRTGSVTVMTIALDLDANDTEEKGQIEALKACASPSKNTAGKVLFWNATGATLDVVFKDIADELSNLRIVG